MSAFFLFGVTVPGGFTFAYFGLVPPNNYANAVYACDAGAEEYDDPEIPGYPYKSAKFTYVYSILEFCLLACYIIAGICAMGNAIKNTKR